MAEGAALAAALGGGAPKDKGAAVLDGAGAGLGALEGESVLPIARKSPTMSVRGGGGGGG